MSDERPQPGAAGPGKGDKPPKSSFELPARLELAIKIIGVLVALAGFAWGVYTYRVTSMRTASKPFYDKQLELYFKATDAAATLATDPDPTRWHLARREFWRLYWGPLSMVEDVAPYEPAVLAADEPRTVEAAMVRFGRVLREIEGTLANSEAAPERGRLESLEQPSLWLAHRLRDSLRASWPVKGDLDPQKDTK